MARKYDKDISVEIELIRKNFMAKDLFEQVSQVVAVYGGDTMMIASDLVCNKPCQPRLQVAYEEALDLITTHGRCTFAGFLQVVEAWGRYKHGSDPKEALYFGEELINWAVQLPVEYGRDPGDFLREDPMDRGEFLEHLDDDVWQGTPIDTSWDVPKIPFCEKSGVDRPIDARLIPVHESQPVEYVSAYKGDFDKDLKWLKDHQYYKHFKLAAGRRGLLDGYGSGLHVAKMNMLTEDYERALAVTHEAYKRRIFK